MLLGFATLAIAPQLFGGGGDEGVDILPKLRGDGGAGGSDGPGAGGNAIPHGVQVGYIAVHGKNAALDANWFWALPGLRLPGHARQDLFLGDVGKEPDSRGETVLDILTKGKRKLMYGEYLPRSGQIAGPEFLTLNGRFEIEDRFDDQRLELSGRDKQAVYWTILVGQRSTTKDSIQASFSRIDSTLTGTEISGRIDLDQFRDEMVALYGGTGADIALLLSAPSKRGTDECWAAFNVDDQSEIWDVEIKVP
ncbi:MAG: hypothetical protein FJ293_01460 [Planctomycetes bacterium]|nr:hypothetical protein [Planctomycetota bacterium]